MDNESSKACAMCQIEKGPDGYYQSAGGRFCKECVKFKARLARKRACGTEDDTSSSPAEHNHSETSLYIFCNPLIPGMVKIGRASCPVARAQAMSSSHPFSLTVCSTYGQMGFLESTVHRRLADRRVTSGMGREWFYASPEEADLIVRATLLEHRWKLDSQS